MPLNPGSVSVNGAGVASGAGLARELYDDFLVVFGVSPAQVPLNVPAAQQQVANLANVIAQRTLAHVIANADITVAAGIPVTVSGSPSTQSGATTAPATATIL